MKWRPLERRILRNAARCKSCGVIVESKHRHDFRSCECGKVAVDGGLDYCRRVAKPGTYEDLTEYERD